MSKLLRRAKARFESAKMFNTWETQTRYFDDFTAVMSLVDSAIERIPALLDFADSFVKEDKTVDV